MRNFFPVVFSTFLAFCGLLAAQPQPPSAIANDAQSSMHLLHDRPPSGPEMTQGCRHLMLDIDAVGFFFDAEYATPYAKGYTVTGFRLSPALVFGINERAMLRVGFNASMFAGLDSLYRARPVMSLIYKPSQWLTLIAGTIYGGYVHQLAAPVYDPSRWIYNYQEDGLQIMTHTKWWESDTWLDWNHYLTPWTPDQEHFTMGTRHLFVLLNRSKDEEQTSLAKPLQGECIKIKSHKARTWKIEIPSHFTASHRGGEVKTIDTNTVTTFNESTGLRLSHIYSIDKKRLRRWSLDLPLYHYHLDNKADHGGLAIYPTLTYEMQRPCPNEPKGWSVCATVGYWHGDHYFSAFGSPLFWSANGYSILHMPASSGLQNAGDQRDIITFTASMEHEFKGLNVGLQVDAMYDTDLQETDFLFGFYMRFKERFLLR